MIDIARQPSADLPASSARGPVAADSGDSLATVRRSYGRGALSEQSVADTWIEQLRQWYEQAAAEPAIGEPNAMQLATVDAAGRPDVRTVLAREISERGVVFYTNYESAKGQQLTAAPYAAAVFAWLPLERQARLRGPVTRVGAEETAAYFASRPREAQIGAWASPQSQPIAGRAELDRRLAEVTERFAGQPLTPPPFWGGYRIQVAEIEFWQGREFRLHDRIRFRRGADGDWSRERLAP
ncbi:MAG: pyridoxamine 5-phosphate oxidase [Frankiales bacterium]|nr:pyridoxamine 5-phosphate oxidase [Frankiales bacterium]